MLRRCSRQGRARTYVWRTAIIGSTRTRCFSYQCSLCRARRTENRSQRQRSRTSSDPHPTRTIARLRTNRPRSLDGTSSDKQVPRRIGVIDRASGSPTLGGLLALGSFPQQFFPQLMISFASYPGGSKDVVVGDEQMLDRAVLEARFLT